MVTLQPDDVCEPACMVPSLTFLIHITMFSPYHFFRDNVANMLHALHRHGLVRDPHNHTHPPQEWPPRVDGEPIRLLVVGQHPDHFNGRNQMARHLSALTPLPIWTAPERGRLCVRFARLLVGAGVAKHTFGKVGRVPPSLGQVLYTPLAAAARFVHCRAPAVRGVSRPRITLLLRSTGSHGKSIGRKILNHDAVSEALSHLGQVRRASFEEYALEKQLRVMQHSDVLVGVHGAGLSNSMFLHSCGLLVELWPLGKAPAGPYDDFHRPYAKYHDRFCNASVEKTCDFAKTQHDRGATHRPLLVDTKALVGVINASLPRWRACYLARESQPSPPQVVRVLPRSRVRESQPRPHARPGWLGECLLGLLVTATFTTSCLFLGPRRLRALL